MKRIPFAKPIIDNSDIENVICSLKQDRLTDGPNTDKFAETFQYFLSDKNRGCYCIPVSSCMAALHLAYLALGIGPGDEVICTAMSHVATAHAIELVGARPVFVDCDSQGQIDSSLISRNITLNTKAIALVHYNGFSCDMTAIMKIANYHGLKVVEDCALALGTYHNSQHVGTIGDAGAFSFYPSKHITTGQGGMFVCKDEEIYSKVKQLISFGKKGGRYIYDIHGLGLNYRMSEMQAALGISQMVKVYSFIRARRKNYNEYVNFFDKFYQYTYAHDIDDSPYAFMVKDLKLSLKNTLINCLQNNNIEFSVYYPHPIPRLSYYADKYGYPKGLCSDLELITDAIAIADRSIALPVGPHLEQDDLDRIFKTLKEVFS